jgi:small GTP-binding protein
MGMCGSIIRIKKTPKVSIMTINNLPFYSRKNVGRRIEFSAIKTQLLSAVDIKTSLDGFTQDDQVIVIQGMAGIGKTTLALELAYDSDIQGKFSDGILWLSLRDSLDLRHSLSMFAQVLGLDFTKKMYDAMDMRNILVEALHNKKILLIIDEVQQADHVAPLLVGGKHSATLITTRVMGLARELAPKAQIFSLDALSTEESLELLNVSAPEAIRQNYHAAEELVKMLGGHPLAIEMMGRILKEEMVQIPVILERLKKDGFSFQNLGDPFSAFNAILLSSIKTLDEHTQKYFALLGVFAPAPATFDIDAMVNVWNLEDPYPVIKALTERSLINKISANHYQTHALIANFAKSLMEDFDLHIPAEVRYFDSPEAINSYFSQKKRALHEAKTLFVGQGSVGKTSLIQRITKNKFDLLQQKTDGISIKHWQVYDYSHSENKTPEIKLNLWDFGGQEIMHATHQFFLTKRSLYVLVLDSRLTQEENRVEYWLKVIQSFGTQSPVLIVGNKVDQHPLDIDRTGLKRKYPNIVDILETSAATGTGIKELKEAITEQVNSLPHVRDLLPETWFTVKTKLEGLGQGENFITHDKYLELCAENEVSDETSQRTLIGFLHDLGVVLHFQDDPRLESLGILNPQWVTNGVYKILNSHELFKNNGVLERAILNEILDTPEYPANKRLFIVDMMRKFELCYDLVTDQKFLVPDLLPKDEPELSFNGIPAFEYAYPVLPSSVITRFIVRMNQKIDDGFVWRTGVLLKIGENKALVKADIEDKKITIAIDGLEHTRRDALSAIRYQLGEIHESIRGLNPQKRVPVPNAPLAEPLKYEYLLKLERAGQETHLVENGDDLITVNVRQMLSGVESEAQRKDHVSKVTNIYVGGDVKDSNIVSGDENEVSNS